MSRLQLLIGICNLRKIIHQQILTCISHSFTNNLKTEIAYETYIQPIKLENQFLECRVVINMYNKLYL